MPITRLMIVAVVTLMLPIVSDAQDSIPPSSPPSPPPTLISSGGSATVSITNLAPYISPFIGLAGTGSTLAACPSGRLMLGVAGRKLKFIQTITPLCGTLNKNGSVASIAPLDPGAVTGTAVFRLECGPGRVATQLRVSYGDYRESSPLYLYLGGIEISCSPWTVSQWSGTAQQVATTNFASWPRKASATCTQPVQPMRSLQIRATTSVKALSIICDEP
jgi:hypothetical protein